MLHQLGFAVSFVVATVLEGQHQSFDKTYFSNSFKGFFILFFLHFSFFLVFAYSCETFFMMGNTSELNLKVFYIKLKLFDPT